ncbi:MAG: lactate racemase domain-containing protein [Clostridiales bacterium]|jgi:nickel-dependent lactate racemase|nr:lactate racemase domain-containing protein [Clostridiales bacterium]
MTGSEIIRQLDGFIREAGERRRVLLIVPDYTRYHSNAGFIANYLYHNLKAELVELIEALGTHVPMTDRQLGHMYGDIPKHSFIPHNWRDGLIRLGEVPGEFVAEVSGGLVRDPIPVEVNRRLFDGYDLVVSIGQVVPHEVVGMANHAKNIFVGCGGQAMINASHMLGAFCGLEAAMGKDHSPARAVFDYAAEKYLAGLPLWYILTVTTAPAGVIETRGVFISRGREGFEAAVALSREVNITLLDEPVQTMVVWLDPEEFQSCWLGNKAIYRTRMAIADGGELFVLAPGADKFGEDPAIDALIRKYGYKGRERVIRMCAENADLRGNLSAAAHLIHGSSDGRFKITYCTRRLTAEEVTGAGFEYMPFEEASERFAPETLRAGYNDGGIYFVPNPALGLWAYKARF